MSFLTFLFALIGAIAVIILIYYIFRNSINKHNLDEKESRVRPPILYMNKIGSKCPNYWINTENNNDKNTCKNSYHFKFPDNKTGPCANYSCTNEINFPNIDDWNNITDKDKDAIRQRCEFTRCCDQTWLGLEDKCRQYA